MADDKQPGRRDVLKLTGSSLGSLVAGSGIAAATESRPGRGRGLGRGRDGPSRSRRGLYVEDGKFELNIDPEQGGPERVDEWQAVVNSFNSAIENGHLSLERNKRSAVMSGSTHGNSSEVATTLEIHSTPAEIVAENSQGAPGRNE